MTITKKTKVALMTIMAFAATQTASLFASTKESSDTNSPIKRTTERSDPSDTLRQIAPMDTMRKTLNDTIRPTALDTLANAKPHRATWYRTEGSRVHRKHPTAAYNFAPIGSKVLVVNRNNGKSCVVEVTDRMGYKKKGFIDLSHSAFGILSRHSVGVIDVHIIMLD